MLCIAQDEEEEAEEETLDAQETEKATERPIETGA